MLKNIYSYEEFLESVLEIGDLIKPVGGDIRGDVLINKLRSGQEIKKDNGKEVKIDKMKSGETWVEPEVALDQIKTANKYDHKKGKDYFVRSFNKKGTPSRYRTVFKDEDGVDFTLKQIFKTPDLGSKGAGVDAGLAEVMQAIFIGIRLESTTELTFENIQKAYDKYLVEREKFPIVMVGEKFEEIDQEKLKKFLNNKNWVETFCKIPNLLLLDEGSDGGYLDPSISYLVYHTSGKFGRSPYNVLKSKYRELSIKEKFNRVNFNKFCPADVYLIDMNSLTKFKSDIEAVQNMYDLAGICDKYFDLKKFVPLSLKMINVGVDFQIITNGEIGADLPIFSIEKFLVSDDPYRGIFSKIETSSVWHYRKKQIQRDRVINFDSSNTSKSVDIDGEVEGSTSRHGKLSLYHIMRIIRRSRGLSQISSFKQLSKYNIDDLDKIMIDLITRIKSDGGPMIKLNTTNRGSLIKGNEKKLISKIQSLQVIKTLLDIYNKDKNKANKIITEIMQFALSVKTRYFGTPRYLRVI